MNWLQILLIHLATIVFIVLIYARWPQDWMDDLLAFIVLGSLIFGGPIYALINGQQINHGQKVYSTGQIISLENSPGVSGSVSGGGSFLASSFSGNIQGATNCVFAVKFSNDEIKIITENANHVIFHESADDNSFAQCHVRQVEYPYRIGGKGRYFYNYDYVTWHVWIPSKSMNRYIRFN